MPDWKGSDRRQTLPTNWPEITLRILRRDHHRCQHVRQDTGRKCGRQARDVDHVISYKDGGSDDDSNLQALCTWHHRQKTGREGGTASGRSRRAKRDAVKPIHPGIMVDPHEFDPPPF